MVKSNKVTNLNLVKNKLKEGKNILNVKNFLAGYKIKKGEMLT